MINSHFDEPSFQGTRGTHGNSNPKDWGLKASMRMYRNRQLSASVGLPSKIPWRIHMNSWLKLREENAAKRELMSLLFLRQRSSTKQALALGTYGGKSYASPEQRTLGVKRAPTEFDLRLSLGTLETSIPTRFLGEMEGEIGTKQMPQVMLGIDLLINPKGCPLPVALLEMDMMETYP